MALFFSPYNARSQTVKQDKNRTTSPISILVEELVHIYQTKVSSKSNDRCPFQISCSNYLLKSIRNEGIIKGTALFIDRYFYRENQFIPDHYQLIIKDRYLYDDTISKRYIDYLYRD